MDRSQRIQELRRQLQDLKLQEEHIRKELSSLEQDALPVTPNEKISFFLSLFRCRSDVYPRYWESRNGNKGYSPVCLHEWDHQFCAKPKVKCSACPNKQFAEFDEAAARDHLTGKHLIGSYAIDSQHRCRFIAADFDKANWKEESLSYKQAAAALGVDAALEISKSGQGSHCWIFFSEPVPAARARKLGELILTRALDHRGVFNTESYDRFIPNQDYLPKGGFGTLIALPLCRTYRDKGSCIFVDDDFIAYRKQWEYLSGLHRLSSCELDEILSRSNVYEEESSPLHAVISSSSAAAGGTVDITIAEQVAVPLAQIDSRTVCALKKLATITNPKFFQAQRMRFSTWNISKYIFCGENDEANIYLPRGLQEDAVSLLEDRGYTCRIHDLRTTHDLIDIDFTGSLHSFQEEAVKILLKSDIGVLTAPTGTGKTVTAVALIARRKRRTLILVHRKALIDQWISELCKYIPGLEKKHIGVLGAGRKKLKGFIDLAMLQSLAKMDDISGITSSYDALVIDECHRVPTPTFDPVVKSINCTYVLGLTATPKRKDGFQSIIFMQCGPIIHTIGDVYLPRQNRTAYFRPTGIDEDCQVKSITELWEFLTQSETRNQQIAEDIAALIKDGKSPLVISDRKEHLEVLSAMISKPSGCTLLTVTGEMGKKERTGIFSSIRDLSEQFCLFATGSLIGEGVDLPDLDTLVITMPISFPGRLTQYVGRLHRQQNDSIKQITVYDYVDTCSGMTISMFKKRLPAYKKLGYVLNCMGHEKLLKWMP